LLRQNEDIQYVFHIKGDGAKMFKAVCELGLEGIVSKKLDSPYVRSLENLDQVQESERTCRDSGFRWGFLKCPDRLARNVCGSKLVGSRATVVPIPARVRQM